MTGRYKHLRRGFRLCLNGKYESRFATVKEILTVELAMRIEKAIAGRQGGDRKSKDKILPLDQPQGKSSEIAAKAVGMNRETYRQAKAVAVTVDGPVDVTGYTAVDTS